MIIQKLELINFRTYDKLTLELYPGCNIFYGENAQGKTNILEAIFSLCFSRSFRTNKEKEIIRFDNSFARAEGQFLSELDIKKEVVFHLDKVDGKTLLLSSKKLYRYSEMIGQFPVVLLSPEDYKISSGGPSERRNAIDILLSQENSLYLKELQKYSRILKQRNKILSDFNLKIQSKKIALEPWNESFVESGSFIINFRRNFINEFNPVLKKVYQNLNLANESISLFYKSSVSQKNSDDTKANFYKLLEKNFASECSRGITLCGPHRDDYLFEINGKDLRIYGSRGQHKSALLTLKLAEFYFLKEQMQETPIILLDDLFSDLDPKRKHNILNLVQDIGQTFITTTEKVSQNFPHLKMNEYFVQSGKVEQCHAE